MKRLVLILGALTLVCGVVWLVRAGTTWRANIRTSKLNSDVENLFVGLQKYKQYVGEFPSGSNAEIAAALTGKNQKNVIIVVGKESELNSKGEYVDPWETPLRIYFSEGGILVRSAGPNKRFDDSTAVACDDFFRSN